MKICLIFMLVVPATIMAQDRPGTFFREDFMETPAEIPVNQAHMANADLMISLHGPGADVIKKSHHDTPADDPYYIWSGLCEGNWAVSLKHKSMDVDLSKNAKIRWRSKQSGFRELHLVIKLSDGTWLISDASDAKSKDWRITEFNVADLSWYNLDMEHVLEKGKVENPDLSRVEEIGWTDLMRGGGSIACSRLDWIEVDGFPVER